MKTIVENRFKKIFSLNSSVRGNRGLYCVTNSHLLNSQQLKHSELLFVNFVILNYLQNDTTVLKMQSYFYDHDN